MIDELNLLTLLYIVTFLLRDLFHEQAALVLYERNKSALYVRNMGKSRAKLINLKTVLLLMLLLLFIIYIHTYLLTYLLTHFFIPFFGGGEGIYGLLGLI